MNYPTDSVNYALVIEDDRFQAETLADTLREAGFRVALAESGLQGLELIGEERPDIVYLDVIMPKMNGFECCRWLRKLPDGDLIPVVMMTSRFDREAIERSFEVGATDFLCKPLNLELIPHQARYILRNTSLLVASRRQQKRLEQTQKIARLGSWEWYGGERFIRVSPELCNLLGYPPSRTRMTVREILPGMAPTDRRKLYQRIQHLQVDQKPFDLICRINLPNGVSTLIRNHTELLTDLAGKPIGFVGFLQDINEVDHWMEHVHLLQSAVNALPLGVTITNKGGQILYTNPAEAALHGYKPDELVGRSARIFAPRDEKAGIPPAQIDRWKAWTRERINVRCNGEEFVARLTSIPVRSEQGEALGMVTICEDVTTQRAAAEKLANAEQVYRALFEASPSPVFLIAADGEIEGTILSANTAACQRFGYDIDELLGRNLRELVAKGNLIPTKPQLRSGWRVELQGVPKERPPFDMELAAELVEINGIPYYLVIISDISLHKAHARAEAAKEAAALEALRKGEFMATLSHELRTPLGGILGMLELLQETRLDPEQQDLTATAHQSSKNLLEIVNQFLDFSKLEAGRLELEQESFSLRGLLDFVAGIFREKLMAKGLDFHIDLDSEIPDVLLGDQGRLRQILLNLVGNAIKFTAAGGVRLQVTQSGENGSGVLTFSVNDTGAGIAPEDIGRIFDPFVQVCTVEKNEGTGLGLTVVRELVGLMGGEISVKSTPGEGSRFAFSIPAPAPAMGKGLTS